MRLSANRDCGRRADPSLRWRRRFFILAASLTLLALLAWRFTARQEPSARASAAARASMAALQALNTLPAAAYGNAWPDPAPEPSAAAVPEPAVTAPATATARTPGSASASSRPVRRWPRPHRTPSPAGPR